MVFSDSVNLSFLDSSSSSSSDEDEDLPRRTPLSIPPPNSTNNHSKNDILLDLENLEFLEPSTSAPSGSFSTDDLIKFEHDLLEAKSDNVQDPTADGSTDNNSQ